jgi:hypothetical protein
VSRRLILLFATLLALGTVGVVAVAPNNVDAATGNCSGTRIDTYPLRYGGTQIAELTLYWNASTGKNCARLNHYGPTYGVASYTAVYLWSCSKPQQSQCFIVGTAAPDAGSFSYYAGPVSVTGTNLCVMAAGVIHYAGRYHWIVSNDSGYRATHCG